ncbi:MAG: hypothetical protein U5N58_08100 [Actinomycetota bacterium]|nr:hypothetical protein [Actinomycetota bacterium]
MDQLIKETNKTCRHPVHHSNGCDYHQHCLLFWGKHFSSIAKQEGLQQPDWESTCTYSPGQYKWTIEEQKEIFKMVDGVKIGVKLNSSFLMVPFKSISGVYGFGPQDQIGKTKVACELCPREDCISRRN